MLRFATVSTETGGEGLDLITSRRLFENLSDYF